MPRGAARRRDRRQRQTANAAGVRVALSGNPAGCSTWLRRLFTGDLVCRPNSQLKSDEVVRHGRRIGRVGADDDGNLCVVRRSVLEHSSKSKHFCVTRAGLARYSAASEIRSSLPQIGRCTSRRIGSCLFVSHKSVESSEIENYYSP